MKEKCARGNEVRASYPKRIFGSHGMRQLLNDLNPDFPLIFVVPLLQFSLFPCHSYGTLREFCSAAAKVP